MQFVDMKTIKIVRCQVVLGAGAVGKVYIHYFIYSIRVYMTYYLRVPLQSGWLQMNGEKNMTQRNYLHFVMKTE